MGLLESGGGNRRKAAGIQAQSLVTIFPIAKKATKSFGYVFVCFALGWLL